MANTEGLPDEFVESLMTTKLDDRSSTATSKNKSSSSLSSNNNNSRRRRGIPISSRLQERLNTPLEEGGRPAATVIRSSLNNDATATTRKKQNQQGANDEFHDKETDATPDANSATGMLSSMIVGEVVERSAQSKTGTAASNVRQKRTSRFKQQQHQQSAGFPSVHMPLGTFVKKGAKKKNPVIRTKTNQAAPNTTVDEKLPKDTTNHELSIEEASQRDAQNMLSEMSMAEIQQYQKDLQAALSPDMKEFLKQRRQKKSQTNSKTTDSSSSTTIPHEEEDPHSRRPIQATTTERYNNNTTTARKHATTLGGPEEKERLAKLMTSVRTHQDLDDAYRNEMKQSHPLEKDQQQQQQLESIMGEGETLPKDQNDFALACDLLRSSVKRQTLWAARVVSQTLHQRVQNIVNETATGPKKQHDWPILLPISLRCLLDEPTGTHGGILHTYVLQSLYSLLLLLLHDIDERAVWVLLFPDDDERTVARTTDSQIFQDDFLEDAIPTTPLETAYPSTTIQPLPTTAGVVKENANLTTPVAAYSTSSSSTSAEEDAKAFEKDPMWTLLSKMRIIPRLAQLLLANKNNRTTTTAEQQPSLPEEAWVAACGILAMLSQRSPGAASAIVHHEALLPRIVDHCLTRYYALDQTHSQQPQDKAEARLRGLLQQAAFAALQLLLTLARQSRVTAKAIVPHMEEILPPLLLPHSSSLKDGDARSTTASPLEHRLQQMAITLWRTLLRYGLGLGGFTTMLKLAAHHWALPPSHPHSLSTEYLTAVAQVLDCARIAQKVPSSSSSSSPAHKNMDAESMTILSMAAAHLAPTRRQLLPLRASGTVAATGTSSTNNRSIDFRWNAATLRFLTSFWSLTDPESPACTNEEIKTEELPMEEELTCLEALDVWTDPGGEVDIAWNVVARSTIAPSSADVDVSDHLREEAAACAFLTSFASLLLTLESSLSRSKEKNIIVAKLTRAVTIHFVERILGGLKLATAAMGAEGGKGESKMTRPRQGWINQCSFAIAKLLCHVHATGGLSSTSDVNLVRLLVFSLLGKLERGNESIAVVLFSQDLLFLPVGNPVQESLLHSSPVSSMFLGELCGSERARKQLDHSFKLQHGFGITSAGFGPFALDSLLSEADQAGPRSSGDLVLPLGQLWLWQSLSGFIRMNHGAVESGTAEATDVVSTVLGVLLELEEGASGYSNCIPLGSKLYYVMNVCLHPEDVLRDERVSETAEAVLERYCNQLQHSTLAHFSKACFQHTEPAKKQTTQGENELPVEENEKRLLEELLKSESQTNASLPAGEMRALEALLEDMVSAYRDFGAQYAFFTKCMRLFLSPLFPSSIRCQMLRELRGMLHLLTIPEEHETDALAGIVERFVSGGLPENDGSSREPADLSDAIVTSLLQERLSRGVDGFFLYYSVATLARGLAIGITSRDMALQGIKMRLNQLDDSLAALVCDTTSCFLNGDGSKTSLVEATLRSCRSTSLPGGDGSRSFNLNETLDRMTMSLNVNGTVTS
eukprot:scaffold672_cov126-Cylindrotheca_fusiformis.AAC.41